MRLYIEYNKSNGFEMFSRVFVLRDINYFVVKTTRI